MRAESTRLRRATGLGVALLVTGLVSSACAAGRDAQTNDQIPTQDGTNVDQGSIGLRGLALETPTTGNYYPSNSDVMMKLVLVNNGTRPDRLTGISTSSAGSWGAFADLSDALQAQTTSGVAGVTPSTTGAVRSVAINPGARVSYGTPDATGALMLLSTKGKIYPGTSVRLRFTFARAGSVTATVPVQLSDTANSDNRTLPPVAGESDAG